MKILFISTSVALALFSTASQAGRLAEADTQMIKANTQSAYSFRDVIDNEPDVSRPVLGDSFKSVSFSFPVNDLRNLDLQQKPSHVQSRQFSMDVTGAELQKGINLNTMGKGALVRISAYDGTSTIEPRTLSITRHQRGKKLQTFAKGSGFDTIVDSQAMQKSGMGFQRGTSGFKLADDLGQGRFTLKAENNPKGLYRINVFDKNSDTELHLTANKNTYLADQRLEVKASVFDQGLSQKISSVKGQIVSPSGQVTSVSFKPSADGFALNMPLNLVANQKPGALWEIQTEVNVEVNGQVVKRNARVPFAYARQTAKFAGTPNVYQSQNQLIANIPVQAIDDGRFEARAILFGTNSQGKLQPIMMTHSAQDVSAGMGAITMKFDNAILKQSGLSAPFEVRHVQLRDQKQMAVLEQ